jgi:hypothetical protein
MDKKKIIIISSAIIAASGIGYLIYLKIRNKKEINQIHAAIDGRSGAYGTIEDFSDVFDGANYINKIKSKQPKLILLKGDYVTTYRKKLYDYLTTIVGTDEEGIKSIFRTLKDKVQIAQVAESYMRNYNVNLLEAIKDDINDDSDDMKELLDIMTQKPAFRIDK